MRSHVFTFGMLSAVGLAAVLGGFESERAAAAQAQKSIAMPVFEVDSNFPTMPDKMLLGGVGGATADSHGNVWVFHRPHTLEEGNATENGYGPAPPVVEFSADRQIPPGLGRSVEGRPVSMVQSRRTHLGACRVPVLHQRAAHQWRWPPGQRRARHRVDAHDNVWLTGNGDGDGQVLKFTKDGKFLLQIGKGGVEPSTATTPRISAARRASPCMTRPTRCSSPTATATAASIVFDATTGAYKRHWGAYGNKPDDKASKARAGDGPGAAAIQHAARHRRFPTMASSMSTDRANNRVQSFTLDGKFIKEGFIKRESQGTGTAFGVALSADPEQRFLYIADGSNERIAILDRASLEEIGHIGGPGRKAGEFFHIHSLDVDPQGNIVTGELQGYRVQKFIYKGLSTAAR